MVKTETKKEYTNIAKEVLRKIVKNNLFVKLEKYMWKLEKLGFWK